MDHQIIGNAPGPGSYANAFSRIGAHIVENIANNKVFDGIVFSISKRLLIPASPDVVNVTLDPTSCTCSFFVLLPLAFKAFGAGPIHVDIYANPDFDEDGTLIESVNRNFTSPNTSDVEWRLGPTINNIGTKLPPEFIILSDGTPAIANAGGESSENQVSNLDITKKYLLQFSNQDSSPTIGAAIAGTWFEVP